MAAELRQTKQSLISGLIVEDFYNKQFYRTYSFGIQNNTRFFLL